MGYFSYGGETYITLDYETASGTPRRSYTVGPKHFDARAKEELADATTDDFNHLFVSIYSENGYMYHTGNPQKVLKLALAGQDYLYAPSVKKVISSAVTAVFLRQGREYTLLWRNSRLQPNALPLFLNKKLLENKLKAIFKRVKLTLGELSENFIPSIAWQVETEQGIFYIPWHNGCLLEESPEFSFKPKGFQAMRATYKILRFAPTDVDVYRVICS